MILINVVAQLLVYQSFASFSRVSLFTILILGFAFPRRFAIRRLFNAMLQDGQRQPRWHSVWEVLTDTVVALVFAFAMQLLIYPEAATWARAGSLTILLYLAAMIRRFLVRRLFVRWERPAQSVSSSPHAAS